MLLLAVPFRGVLHGRTEYLRPLSRTVRDFCRALCRETARFFTNRDLAALLRTFGAEVAELKREAGAGRTAASHLYGLQSMAHETGLGRLDVFQHRAFQTYASPDVYVSCVPGPSGVEQFGGPPMFPDAVHLYGLLSDDALTVTFAARGQQVRCVTTCDPSPRQTAELWQDGEGGGGAGLL